MRLAVLADIHGNLPALQAVVDDLARHQVDGIIVAGDLTGGPQANEVIRLLRSLRCQMIRGNGDSDLLRYSQGVAPIAWYTRAAFATLRWHFRQASRETLAFLRSLPEQRLVKMKSRTAIRLVHGSPRDPCEPLAPFRDPEAFRQALAELNEPVLVCGHTHTPWVLQRGDWLAMNPGAVCGPLDGTVGAQYGLLSWDKGGWQAEHWQVTYDIGLTRTAFRDSGLLKEGGAFARSILCAIETGRNVTEDFLNYARRLTAEAGFKDTEIIPDTIWDQATDTFPWPNGNGIA